MQTVRERSEQRPVQFDGRTKKGHAPHHFKWTVDEYYRLYEQGLFEGRRVELIKGEIFEMSPMLSPHATSVGLVSDILAEIFQKGFFIRVQMPMSFSRIDEPEPDVAVITGARRNFTNVHPKSAELLVEVAQTSLRFDRTKKMSLYAENVIEDYWIVNLKQRRLEVFRQPVTIEGGFDYAEKFFLKEEEFIAPLAMPKKKVKVADLLP